jgi:hypothetical protein
MSLVGRATKTFSAAGSMERRRLPGFRQRGCGVAALDFDHREPAMHRRGRARLGSALLRAAVSA